MTKHSNSQALHWKAHALLNHKEESLDASKRDFDYRKHVFKMHSAIGQPTFKNLTIIFELRWVLPSQML